MEAREYNRERLPVDVQKDFEQRIITAAVGRLNPEFSEQVGEYAKDMLYMILHEFRPDLFEDLDN